MSRQMILRAALGLTFFGLVSAAYVVLKLSRQCQADGGTFVPSQLTCQPPIPIHLERDIRRS